MIWTVIAYCTLAGPADSLGMDSVFVHSSMVTGEQPASDISNIDGKGIGNALLLKSSLPIRQAGATGVATFAVRGTAAHQNQVLWNGISINNALLGQVDLNQIVLSNGTNVIVNESSNASINGSGAVGGILYINTNAKYVKHKNVETGVQFGNFGMRNANIYTSIGSNSLFISAAAAHTVWNNNYKIKELNNAKLNEANSQNTMAESTIAGRNKWGLWKWAGQLVNSNRSFPNYATNSWAGALQTNSLRTMVEFKTNKVRKMHSFLGAAVKEAFRYTDLQRNLQFTEVISYTARYNFNYKINSKWVMQSIADGGIDLGTVSGQNRNIPRMAIAANLYFKPGKHVMGLQQRWDAAARKYIYKLLYDFNKGTKRIFFSCGNTFRNATLNEYYWYSSVKRNLKPEMGLVGEVGGAAVIGLLKLDAIFYARSMHDEIMWVPLDNTSMPVNIGKNKVLGVDLTSTTKWNWKKAEFNWINTFQLWNANYSGNAKSVWNYMLFNTLQVQGKKWWFHLISKFQNVSLPYMEITRVPYYYSLDASTGMQMGNTKMLIGVDNITNRANYIIGNQQLMRRSLHVGINYRINRK